MVCMREMFTVNTELKTVFSTFLYSVPYKAVQLVCKLISIRLILFNDFMKEEGPKTKFMQ